MNHHLSRFLACALLLLLTAGVLPAQPPPGADNWPQVVVPEPPRLPDISWRDSFPALSWLSSHYGLVMAVICALGGAFAWSRQHGQVAPRTRPWVRVLCAAVGAGFTAYGLKLVIQGNTEKDAELLYLLGVFVTIWGIGLVAAGIFASLSDRR
jgi:hypothetical protein